MDPFDILSEYANDDIPEVSLAALRKEAQNLRVPEPEMVDALESLEARGLVRLDRGATRGHVVRFSRNFHIRYRRRVRVVHISDLHFSLPGAKGDGRDQIDPARNPREIFLKDGPALLGDIDALVVSGDLATVGAKEELKGACEYIEDLRDRFLPDETKRSNVVVVHGNHDASWENARRYFADPGEKFHEFSSFLARNNWTLPSYPNSYHKPFLPLGGHTLLWAFNSSLGSGLVREHVLRELVKEIAPDDKPLGSLSGTQYERLTRFFQEDIPAFTNRGVQRLRHLLKGGLCDTALRVAVCHHNLVPIPEERWPGDDLNKGARVAPVDAGYFAYHLMENRFQVVLHGHIHRSTASVVSSKGRQLLCLGAPRLSRDRNAEADCSTVGFSAIDFLVYKASGKGEARVSTYPIEGDSIGAVEGPTKHSFDLVK